MNATGTGFTDIGKIREVNEDVFLADNELGLYIVSDGMGGHAAGDVAAREAVQAVERYVRDQEQLLTRIRAGLITESWLSSIASIAVSRACRDVFRLANTDKRLHGMGCTLTVLLIGRNKAAMAHVGDSRLYVARDNTLEQLSVDHSVAEEFVRRGLVNREQMFLVPQGHALARAIGVNETVEVDEMLFDINANDRFILCSDGVWSYLEDPREMEEFLYLVHPEEVAESLVRFANSAGGEDNATALVIRVDNGDAARERHLVDSLDSVTMKLLRTDEYLPVRPVSRL